MRIWVRVGIAAGVTFFGLCLLWIVLLGPAALILLSPHR
jgi:hypothetical protein